MFHVPNKYRLRTHAQLGSDDSAGNNGFFLIPHYRIDGYIIAVMASDGAITEGEMKWEHVSVSVASGGRAPSRNPTWEEMCWVKDLFWDKEDCCIQFHPAESEYVNVHPYVLHIWRPVGFELPIPNKKMVG